MADPTETAAWAEPGLTPGERAAAFTDDPAIVRDLAAVLCAVREDALEDAASVADDLGFMAVAARIRRLKGKDR